MTLTSMMLYLDRVTEVDVETAKYSETQVGKCKYNEISLDKIITKIPLPMMKP